MKQKRRKLNTNIARKYQKIHTLTSTVLRSPVAVDLDNIHDIVAYENINIIIIHSLGTSQT